MEIWRLLDTGAKSATENIALDSALLRARSQDQAPDTLHFLQYDPPAALIGFFQSPAQELRLDYCRARGIDVQRRVTGGGALYFDSTHLGWELIGRKSRFGLRQDQVTERICSAVAAGLRLLGVDAAFRARNDIEVGGRKVSGTGGVFEGDAFLFQGTLLVDLDAEAMIKSLRIPTEKLSAKGLSSVRERVTSLKEELGGGLPPLADIKDAIRQGFERELGITFKPGAISEAEASLWEEYAREYSQPDWRDLVCDPVDEHQVLRSVLRSEGGLIRMAASVDTRRSRLKQCLISGDFFISPRRLVFDLESALKNIPIAEAPAAIDGFFRGRDLSTLSVTPEDFQRALDTALAKTELVSHGIDIKDANSVFMVNGDFNAAIDKCALLLLPYCAKPLDCDFRDVDGCDMCGRCSVGEAYEMAAAAGLEVISIHDYEHLKDTLESSRRRGVSAYVGCCCEAFFVKRQRTFMEAGMPAILLDISEDTCYQLGAEEQAYRGEFENQTELRLDLLEKVLRAVQGVKSGA